MVTCVIQMAGVELGSRQIPDGLSAEATFMLLLKARVLPMPRFERRGVVNVCDAVGITVNGVEIRPHEEESCELCGQYILQNGDTVVYDYNPHGDPEMVREALAFTQGLRALVERIARAMKYEARMSAKALLN